MIERMLRRGKHFTIIHFDQQATGAQIGIIMSAISSIGAALAIAFSFGWKLAFVVTAFLPFIVLSGLIQARLMSGSARRDKDSLEDAARVF